MDIHFSCHLDAGTTTNQVMETNIKDTLIETLQESVDLRKFSNIDTTRFEDDLRMDSLDMVEVIVALERKLEITIEEKNLVGVQTIQDLVNAISAIINTPSTSTQSHDFKPIGL